MSQPKRTRSEHSGLYRPPGDLRVPRVVSSAPNQVPAYYLPAFQRVPWSSALVCDGATRERIKLKQDCASQRTIVPTRQRRGTCTKAWMAFNGLFPDRMRKRTKKHDVPFISQDPWKAYGYSTHSVVDRAKVHSSTFQRSSSVTSRPTDLWTGLRMDDSRRLGNWTGGIQHPTQCPLAHTWTWSRSSPCHYVRLNPNLQHHCNKPHPIAFDITRGPKKIIHTIHTSSTSTISLKQPATYPPMTHMHIQPVAEDPLPHFPWPIEIANPRGITCGDVLDAIARKLLEYVPEKEYNGWTHHRRVMAARTYHQRARKSVDPAKLEGALVVRDGLRRIDYVGGKVIFHGLEQASVTVDDTWFMFLGASGRSMV